MQSILLLMLGPTTINLNRLIPPRGMVSINALPNRISIALKDETWKLGTNVCCKLPTGFLDRL